MLTTLSIISLDQGRIWNPEAVPSEEEAALREAACETQNGGPRPPFWRLLVGRVPWSGRPQRA